MKWLIATSRLRFGLGEWRDLGRSFDLEHRGDGDLDRLGDLCGEGLKDAVGGGPIETMDVEKVVEPSEPGTLEGTFQ